ncbi:hypothetical protein PMIN03_005982 [Paraphaeosphaeria minitans]
MPPGYNTQQKAAISQFMSFASTDQKTAIKVSALKGVGEARELMLEQHLKNAGWDPSAAVNAYFSGGGGSGAASLSKSSLNKLFDSLRDDKNSPDTVGPEGAMGYFEKLGVDLEGMDALAVMEVIQAPTMGELGREGFVEGWSSLNADTLDKQKAHLKSLKQRLPTDKAAFDKVYKYTFLLGRPAGAKAVPLDSALAFWELLFTSPLSAMRWSTPNSPWSEWWSEFLNSEWKKSVNKDMWNETLKFAKLTLEDEAMSFWDESSSWPSVIDDFVEWVKQEKRPSQNTVDEMEE